MTSTVSASADSTSTDTTSTSSLTADFDELFARVADGVVRRELDNVNPFDQVKLVAESPLSKLRLPVERGGSGASVRELFAAVIGLAAADPTVAHIYRTHFWLTEEFLNLRTDNADRFLDLVAAGKVFANATSERGTKAAGDYEFSTTLTPVDDHFVLNGEKFYSTGTLFADYVSVWSVQGTTLTSLVVPTDRAGIEIVDDWDGFGQRRTGSGTTRLRDVEVHREDLLREVPFDEPLPQSTQGAFVQLYLHAIIAGILRAVVADAKALVAGRSRNFSHASSPEPTRDPSLQQVVGELASLAFVTESTVLIAAEALDAATASAVDGIQNPALAQQASLAASKAKVVLDEIGTRAATLLFEAGGASAAGRDKDLDRHWRNIRTITLHNPARLKAQAVGANVLLDQDLPANGYF
ncbi:acyl-CoA dehydrogenase [Gordonia sp. ABSL1-1]|uniref:acyl-CoA dehydrogenase family protein n=1 Tax=Gordonia sp. ABSL1-1 TaxID=3053923 RepID=UPI0025735136|nr:acyl-CoA dehydrogenase family protein [Gordonia sp. ABSL1-1]MDL9938796.1 acyl-CoA dehydrogenase [Gordonia sp. ABSL1-1]